MKSGVPTYDFYKRLNTPLSVEYSRLEKAYNSYDATHAHRHDYFEILIFEKSGGIHEIDFVNYPVKQHSLHFLSPGQVHLLRRNKGVTGHVLAFKEEAFLASAFTGKELLMPSPGVIPVLPLKKSARDMVYNNLSNLISEFSKPHEYSRYSLSAYLTLFLIEVIRLFEENNKQQSDLHINNLYHNFRRLVDKKISETHSVAEYADMLNVSPGHLNDTIKSQSGKSASEIIHDRLILEAKRLLYHSALSVKEIASILNYDDPAYFTRFFKKHVMQTPIEFRDKIRSRS